MEGLPKGTMYDDDILFYAAKLKIPNFIGVRMRDELVSPPQKHDGGFKPEHTPSKRKSLDVLV